MAQVTQVIDDLTGEAGAETELLLLDGQYYEIDLADSSRERLHAALAEFVSAGRKVKGPGKLRGPRVRSGNPAPNNYPGKASGSGVRTEGMTVAEQQDERDRVRAWLRDKGHDVPDRGRLRNEWVREYYEWLDGGGDEQPGEEDGPDLGPLPAVTDAEIVEWAKQKGLRVVAGRCSAALRTKYRTEHTDRVLEHDTNQGAETA